MDEFCVAYPRYDYFSVGGNFLFSCETLAERGLERADEERGSARCDFFRADLRSKPND